MQVKPRNHSIDSLFSFLLLLTFSLFTLMLAGMGSTIYRSGTEYLDENYTSRTAIAYISEKVRQHDQADSVFLTSVEDLPALAFRDMIDDASFLTYVYFHDGALRELFIPEGRTPNADMGNRIVALSDFTIEAVSENGSDSSNMLSASAVSEKGNELSVLIHISSTQNN